MTVGVAIPVLNQLDLTRRVVGCLEIASGFDDLLIIDNGSTDGTAEWVQERGFDYATCPDLTLTQMWNVALERADLLGFDKLALLNNDIRFGPGFLTHLAAALDAQPDHWLAYAPEGPAGPPSGPEWTYTRGTKRDGGLTGHAFMLKVPVCIETVGLFDEQFMLWYADDDYARRVQLAGGLQCRVGSVRCDHDNEGTVSLDPGRWEPVKRADGERYATKYGLALSEVLP